MSNEIELSPSGTETEPTFGISHPTVDVEMPDGQRETVEPDYDIISAHNPLDAKEIGETLVSRLELSETAHGPFSKESVRENIATALEEFIDEYGPMHDRLRVELAYFRTVGDERSLCVQLRGPSDDREGISRLAMQVDERLRSGS